MTPISLPRLLNPMEKIKKLKVAWICGQFSKIPNYFNFFTTTMHEKDKKSWKLLELVVNLLKFQNISTLHQGYETHGKVQKSWKFLKFMWNLVKFQKSWKWLEFMCNLVNFQNTSTSLLWLWNSSKGSKNWKLYEFVANLVKFQTT